MTIHVPSQECRIASEVPICDMDHARSLLIGIDGRTYHEVETNIWAPVGELPEAVYLGTGRHGGGIVLRLLYRLEDGVWRNVSTGRKAPFDTLSAAGTLFDE